MGRSIEVVIGQRVPCTGLLVDREEAKTAIEFKRVTEEVTIPQYEERIQSILNSWATSDAQWTDDLNTANERGDRYQKLYEKTASESEPSSPWLPLGIGFGVGVLVTGLVWAAAN